MLWLHWRYGMKISVVCPIYTMKDGLSEKFLVEFCSQFFYQSHRDFDISLLLSAPIYTLTQIQLAQVYVDTQGHRQAARTRWGLCSPSWAFQQRTTYREDASGGSQHQSGASRCWSGHHWKGRQLPDPAKSDRKNNLIFTVLAQNRLTRSGFADRSSAG